MPKKTSFADILKNLPPKAEKPDILQEMGQSVLRVPFNLWEERFYFRGALNTALREKIGVFPARLGQPKETHPIFLLRKLGNFSFQVCPCTSKRQSRTRYNGEHAFVRVAPWRLRREQWTATVTSWKKWPST